MVIAEPCPFCLKEQRELEKGDGQGNRKDVELQRSEQRRAFCGECVNTAIRIGPWEFPGFYHGRTWGHNGKLVDQIRTLEIITVNETAMESSAIVSGDSRQSIRWHKGCRIAWKLKFLEEPTGNIHFILLTEQPARFWLRFNALSDYSDSNSDVWEKPLFPRWKERGGSNATAQLLSQLASNIDQAVEMLGRKFWTDSLSRKVELVCPLEAAHENVGETT